MSNKTTPITDELFEAVPAEAGALKSLERQIEQIYGRHDSARLLDGAGNAAEIPASALRAFRLVVRRMAEGETLALLAHGDELTTQQAAELLNVSRPHVIKLLEEGEIAFHKVGSHRRIATSDVLAYRARRNARRHEKLDELIRISEELPGGYQ
ncbi:MAG: helix-turn-helix domain-containing protein [Solirubrobacteraceae bacterium]